MLRYFLIMASLLWPLAVVAEVVPEKSHYDSRLRVIDYNPMDVTRITTFYGVSSLVQFSDTEVIQDVAVGDDQAWNIIPRGSNLFIKPKAKNADTNVTVVTNKRVYHLALTVVPRSLKDPSAWRDPELTYGLIYRYPQDEAAKLEELARQELLHERQESIKNKLADSTKSLHPATANTNVPVEPQRTGTEDVGRGPNYDYWVAGSPEISPTAARDDGRFTYLEFTNNRDMPAVYMVDTAGKEALVNTSVEGNTIIIHRVVPKLTLRRGMVVACIRNSSFDWDGGKDNSLGTTSPEVERIVKEPR